MAKAVNKKGKPIPVPGVNFFKMFLDAQDPVGSTSNNDQVLAAIQKAMGENRDTAAMLPPNPRDSLINEAELNKQYRTMQQIIDEEYASRALRAFAQTRPLF